MNGNIITEFIGLKPKMYSLKTEDNNEQKKAKGIPKNTLKKEIIFEMYLKTFNENYKSNIQFNNIRSKNHEIFSITCNKIGLSNYCNKRFYISNNYSLPYGHFLLKT